MKEFKKKRQFRRRIYSKYILFVLFLIFIFIINGVWGVFQKSKESNEKLMIVKEEFSLFEQKNRDLSNRISFLNTEAGVEKEIRTKYNLAKDGERAIVIVEGEIESVEFPEDRETKGIWYNIKSWFTD